MDEKELKTIDTEAEITELQIVEPQILSADINVTTNFEDVKKEPAGDHGKVQGTGRH